MQNPQAACACRTVKLPARCEREDSALNHIQRLQHEIGAAQQGRTTMNLMGKPLLLRFRVSRAPDRSRTAVNTAMPMVLPHHASLSGCCLEPASVRLHERPAPGENIWRHLYTVGLIPDQACGAGEAPRLP